MLTTRKRKKNTIPKVLNLSYIQRLKEQSAEISTDKPFLNYAKRNKKKFVALLHNSTSSISPSMKFLDNRMDIGQIVVMSLVYGLEGNGTKKTLCRIENSSYDLIFQGPAVAESVSVKSSSGCIKKMGKKGKYLQSSPIIIKNGMNNNNKVKSGEFDYLLVVQPQNIDNNEKLCIGIATFSTVMKLVAKVENQTAEIRCRFDWEDWDFVYEHDEFLPEKDLEKVDNLYLEIKDELYRKVLGTKSLR